MSPYEEKSGNTGLVTPDAGENASAKLLVAAHELGVYEETIILLLEEIKKRVQHIEENMQLAVHEMQKDKEQLDNLKQLTDALFVQLRLGDQLEEKVDQAAREAI